MTSKSRSDFWKDSAFLLHLAKTSEQRAAEVRQAEVNADYNTKIFPILEKAANSGWTEAWVDDDMLTDGIRTLIAAHGILLGNTVQGQVRLSWGAKE